MKSWFRKLFLLAAGVPILGIAPAARAQESIESRLERLEKQNEELRKRNDELLNRLSASPAPVSTDPGAVLHREDVNKIIDEYLTGVEKKKVEEKKATDPWYQVGTNLKMSATWKNGFVVNTPNDDFSLHVGGWIQYDNVFWTQSKALLTPKGGALPPGPTAASGPAVGGIGDLQDGMYFRRERIMLDGKFWENFEYTLIFAFENDTFSTNGLDEFWVGATNIPIIGTARIGHVKNCVGLEGDMTASSRTMTFMERSSYSEAIEQNENFVTGLWLGNNYFDQRATWSGVIFRQDPGSSTGAYFGDGQWGWQGRLTSLPIYANDGRCLLHLGLSGGWRNGVSNNVVSTLRQFQLRARPELRDDDPAGAFSGGVGANGNSNRMVDTGVIVAQREWLAGLELLYINGPFSLQAEYGWNWIDGAQGINPAGFVLNPAFAARQNYLFSGGYVQLAYTLTGENRSYDKRLGRLDSYYFGRKGLNENAYFVRGEDGSLQWGLGAWEIAARYSYLDLNDGSGATTINGGRMDGFTVGLNWYLNDNLKFQFDWVYDRRKELPAAVLPGYTSGFGMRMQFMY
ncbi:MAG: porin [Gemmataceae bacterium]